MNSLLFVALIVVLLIAALLVRLGRSRPERATLVLGVIVVVVGLAATGVEVATGIDDRQIDFHGALDLQDFDASREEPGTDPAIAASYAYLNSIDGEMTKPGATTNELALWSIAKLAPWLLAAIVLVLVLPILRAARRGDPFWHGATKRLNIIGVLLLLGVPGIAILRFVAATGASVGNALDPFPTPELSLSITQLLPGFLVLALVGIFRRGVELRDLDRATI